MSSRHKNQCHTTPRIEIKGKFLDFSLTQKTTYKKSMENILIFDKSERSQKNSARSLKPKQSQVPNSFQESFCSTTKFKLKNYRKKLPPLK